MDYVEQAKELLERTQTALKAMNHGQPTFTEDEVIFRYRAIEGMLIMANNDIGRMVRVWEDDAETAQ